ncbi:MAG: hypothetical protein ACR2I2_20340 [Bryobacteraceae bacterium]
MQYLFAMQETRETPWLSLRCETGRLCKPVRPTIRWYGDDPGTTLRTLRDKAGVASQNAVSDQSEAEGKHYATLCSRQVARLALFWVGVEIAIIGASL